MSASAEFRVARRTTGHAARAEAVRIGRFAPATAGPLRRLKRWFAHQGLRAAMRLFNRLVPQATDRRMPRPARTQGLEILLTGTFHAGGWVNAHLRPLAAAKACRRVTVVSTFPVPAIPNVVAVYTPAWLRRLLGDVQARLLVFVATALWRRPDVVGGFHLLVNGLAASVLARFVGGKSLYFCVGGPLEVLDGGIWAENRLFGLMETPDPAVEAELIRAAGTFDAVITMGRKAVRFFEEHGVATRFEVVPGGIDAAAFRPADGPPQTDLILVGRLAEIKRIDIFLRAVAEASRRLPGLSAVIVGDGELRDALRRMAEDLGVASRVRFVGPQANVSEWLRTARAFVLTSDSEGLALSLMEAMMCGLPAIVSNVGELGDLVTGGVNGYLVERRDVEGFAARFVDVLSDPQRLARLSHAARETSLAHEVTQTTRRWNKILTEWLGR